MVKIINKLFLYAALSSAVLSVNAPQAKEISMNTAKLQAMDKITGRVSVLEAPVNALVNFGSFSILVRACKTRPPEETPDNFAFVDVVDVNQNNQQMNIFKGWMISSSPALHAVEHPIYDVWLLKCLNTNVDKSKLLNEEQLKARDEIPQQQNIELADTFSENSDTLSQNTLEISTPDETSVNPEVLSENKEKNSHDEILSAPLSSSEEGGPESLINIPSETLNEDINMSEDDVSETSSQPDMLGNDVLPENSVEEISDTPSEISADSFSIKSEPALLSENPQDVPEENSSLSSSDIQLLSEQNVENNQNSDDTSLEGGTLIQKDGVQFIEFNVDESISPELNADALSI